MHYFYWLDLYLFIAKFSGYWMLIHETLTNR
jgi:hypothetical protein